MHDNWQTLLLEALADEPLCIRDHIGDFLALSAVDKQFKTPLPWRKDALRKLGHAVKVVINTHDKLTCFDLCLLTVYQHQQQRQTELLAPKQIVIMPKEDAAISDDNLPCGTIDKILTRLYQPDELPLYPMDITTYQQQLGRWLLLCAFECNLTSEHELDEVLSIAPNDWQRYLAGPAITVMLPVAHRRVWLQPVSGLLYKHLVDSQHYTSVKRIKGAAKKAIKAYIKATLTDISQLATLSVGDLIADIGLFHQPIGLRKFWQYEQSLPNEVIERLFTQNKPVIVADKTQKKQNIQEKIPVYSQHNDALIRRKVTTYLQQYHIINPKEVRRHRSFNDCLAHLKGCLTTPISVGLYLTISWIIELFEQGSPWKEKLVSSTLINYFSAITQFQLQGYQHHDITQYSTDALSDVCQTALYCFEDAQRQYTVLRFLLFIQRCPSIPALKVDELALLTQQGTIRANYLLPTQFDDACESFMAQKGSYEAHIVHFMRLCYYLGLRESEALSLTLGDIDFEVGLLFITARIHRKSPAAIRHIPLCLMPKHYVDELAIFHARRYEVQESTDLRERDDALLFVHWDYSGLEIQFITHLRAFTHDETWVTHLLRHCFANNQLLVFSSMTGLIAPMPTHFAHSLFAQQHQATVRKHFSLLGRKIDIHFPTLDWIALVVGHASPATTATIYLHLLDWVVARKFKTPYALTKQQLQQWISPGTNYVFDVLHKISHEEKNAYHLVTLNNDDALHWLVAHHKTFGQYFPDIDVKQDLKVQELWENRVAFSTFYQDLDYAQQGGSDAFIHPSMRVFIATCEFIPTLPAIKQKHFPEWVRFCQHLEGTVASFNSLDNNALTLLAHKVKENENVQGIRELTIYLRALRILNLHQYKIQVIGNNEKRRKEWQGKIEQAGHSMVIKKSTSQRISATLKPSGLQWPLWQYLDEIMDLYTHYARYRLTFKEGTD